MINIFVYFFIRITTYIELLSCMVQYSLLIIFNSQVGTYFNCDADLTTKCRYML